MPSCTGVVHAGSRRPTPETSTMHRRQAPTDEMPASPPSVGMYLPPARATSRMVCPSCAGTYSPSIRIEMFSGIEFSLHVGQGGSLRRVGNPPERRLPGYPLGRAQLDKLPH